MAEHIIDGIRVIVEKDGSGLFFATSPDENFVIAKPTVEAALAAVPEVLRRLALMREIMERDDGVLEALS